MVGGRWQVAGGRRQVAGGRQAGRQAGFLQRAYSLQLKVGWDEVKYDIGAAGGAGAVLSTFYALIPYFSFCFYIE